MRECVYFYWKTKRERNVSNRVSEPEHFWYVYTPVARGSVPKLTMTHSSSDNANGLSEIPDPLKPRKDTKFILVA